MKLLSYIFLNQAICFHFANFFYSLQFNSQFIFSLLVTNLLNLNLLLVQFHTLVNSITVVFHWALREQQCKNIFTNSSFKLFLN